MSKVDTSLLNHFSMSLESKAVDNEQATTYNKHSGGGNGGGMEERVARIESDIEYIKRDIGEIKSDLNGFKSETANNFKDFRSETANISNGIKADIVGLRLGQSSLVTKMSALMITCTGLIIAAIKYL